MNFPFFIFFRICANGKVVHIDDEPSFSDVICEVVVHECLESWRRSTEAKEHDGQFEQSLLSDECCLPFVSFFDANVVISPTDIKLRKVGEVVEVVDEVSNKGKGISILDSVFIQVSVILYWVKFSVFLFNKEER